MKDYCVLVKFSKDWADEFTVSGFKVYQKSEWDDILELADKYKEYTTSYYFGSNEGWEEEIGDFFEAYTATKISNEERDSLNNLFGSFYGEFPEPMDVINEDGIEEDDIDEDV